MLHNASSGFYKRSKFYAGNLLKALQFRTLNITAITHAIRNFGFTNISSQEPVKIMHEFFSHYHPYGLLWKALPILSSRPQGAENVIVHNLHVYCPDLKSTFGNHQLVSL